LIIWISTDDSSPNERACEAERKALRFAPNKIDARMSATSWLSSSTVDPCNLVGQVLSHRLGGSFGVGRLVGHGVNRRPPNVLQPDRICMDRDQKVGLMLARDADALVQSEKQITVTGYERRRKRPVSLERLLQFERKCERYGLFQRAGHTLRTGIDATMASVDDDPEAIGRGVASPCRHGRPGRLCAS
jgi:hypothetical protein